MHAGRARCLRVKTSSYFNLVLVVATMDFAKIGQRENSVKRLSILIKKVAFSAKMSHADPKYIEEFVQVKPIPVRQSHTVMTELVLPQHTNSLGSIFGGVIMSWIDICAAIAGSRHSSCQVVTASIDALNFVAPVYQGWIVNLRSSVNYVSRTSMEVGVRVDAENPIQGKTFHTASAYLTFVGVDETGLPLAIPPLLPETDAEKRRYEAAKARRAARLAQLGRI